MSFYASYPASASGGGGGVTSLNTLTGAVVLAAGTNITLTPSGNTITISSTDTTGITSINGNSTAAQLMVSATTGTNFTVTSSGGTTTFALPTASAVNRGALSSADWSLFNGKQDAGNYITALTGDVTAAGPGSAAATLATVNANVGSFGSASQVATFTVNGKGLVTAAGNSSIQIAESQVTNLVADLAAKQSTALTTNNILVGAAGVATDVAMSGDASIVASGALTLATVNANVGSFGSSTAIPSFTVNGKGLLTAASTSAVVAPAGTLTGATLAAGVTASSLTSVGTIATGVWNGTAVDVPHGGTGAASFTSNKPLIGAGASAITVGATSGNTTTFATTTGSLTSGNYAQFDASGNIKDGGSIATVVSAQAYCSTNQAIGTTQSVNFDTVVYDSNSAITTGSGWVFTAPSTGKYMVMVWLSNNPSTGTTESIRAIKNGSIYMNMGVYNVSTMAPVVSGVVPLSINDTLAIRGNVSDTVGGSSFPGASASWISIQKVG